MKTFLAYAGASVIACTGAGALAVSFGVVELGSWLGEEPAALAAPVVPVPIAAPPAAAPPAPELPAVPSTARAVDDVVLSYLGKKALAGDKLKDVTAGRPYKVNLYQDAGQAKANRAKVDLDRDEKWDEKFTFKGGEVERQVAPADDEAYTETYRWAGSDWVKQ
jgi:hypothetical protein